MKPASLAIWKYTALALATGLGIGYLRPAPGTWGSLWGLVIAWQLKSLPPVGRLALLGPLVLMGVPVCGRAARAFGREDPGGVVFDEFAALPFGFVLFHWSWPIAFAGFVLFRLFDVTKPWPACRLERLPGGWGIMADDLAAAIYAALVLALGVWMFGAPQDWAI